MLLAKATKAQPKISPRENYHEGKGQTRETPSSDGTQEEFSWATVCVINLNIVFYGHAPPHTY